MLIESIDNKKIKMIRKLNNKKYRDEYEKFIVEGIHLVEEAYKSGNLDEVFILSGNDYNFDIPKTYVTSNVLKHISNLNTPYDIIGICNYKKEEEIGNKVLILDDIQDPGNLGTIIRSSVAFNVDTIILSNHTVDLYNDKVLRAAQGENFHINIIRCDLEEKIKYLKNNNYKWN